MTEGEGRLEWHHAGLEVMDQVQIRVTHPRTGDPQEHLPWSGVRLGYLSDLRCMFPSGELHCSHDDGPPWLELSQANHIEEVIASDLVSGL